MWNIRGFIQRFSVFFGAGVATVLFGWALLYIFHEWVGLAEDGWAYVLKLGLVIVFNFYLNDKITWKGEKASRTLTRGVYFIIVKIVIAVPNSVIYLLLLPYGTMMKEWTVHVLTAIPFVSWIANITTHMKDYVFVDAVATALIMFLSFALDDKYVFRRTNGKTEKR